MVFAKAASNGCCRKGGRMNREQWLWTLGGAGAAAFCGTIFLCRPWFTLLSCIVGWRLGKKYWKAHTKRQHNLLQREQFATFLEIFSSRLEAGSNVPQALLHALGELSRTYRMDPTEPGFLLSLRHCLDRLSGGISLRESLEHWIEESEDPLIRSFLENFAVGRGQGANLAELAKSFSRLLTEQEALRKDREAKLAGSKREQGLLFAMPMVLLIVLYATGLSTTRYGLMDYLVRLVCGALFYGAWRWTNAILADSGLQNRKEET